MPTRLTTDEFLFRAKKVHGGKYGYSKVAYVNSRTPITIGCITHRWFINTPNLIAGIKSL